MYVYFIFLLLIYAHRNSINQNHLIYKYYDALLHLCIIVNKVQCKVGTLIYKYNLTYYRN